MFTSQPIGFISSPYRETKEIPKGLGAQHQAEGVLKILPDFAPGLTDVEGFSHLIVLWEFDRSTDFDLICNRPWTINRMEYLPHALRGVPIRLA
jgi:tRNA (Thr-GGU) A37 N-methylase